MMEKRNLASRLMLYVFILTLVLLYTTAVSPALHGMDFRRLRKMLRPTEAERQIRNIPLSLDRNDRGHIGFAKARAERTSSDPDNSNGNEAPATKPCCSPSTLQGTTHLQDETRSWKINWVENKEAQISVAYFVVMSPEGEMQHRFTQLVKYDEKIGALVGYFYGRGEEKERCRSSVLRGLTIEMFGDSCIPAHANYNGVVKVGLDDGGDGLGLHSWNWNDTQPLFFDNNPRTVDRLVTSQCTPVMDVYRSGHKQMFFYYTDVSTTIQDQSVFEIPSYCPSPTDDDE